MESLLALAANTYSYYLLDAAMRAREFEVLRRLVQTVPVRAVSAPNDFAGIGQLCDGILADLNLPPRPAPLCDDDSNVPGPKS
jgi:hypothetical protein